MRLNIKLVSIAIVGTIAFCLIFLLFIFSTTKLNSAHGFERNFKKNLISIDKTIKTGNIGYYFIGSINNIIYINSITDPLKIGILEINSHKILFQSISIPKEDQQRIKAGYRVDLRYPFIYYQILNKGIIYEYNIHSKELLKHKLVRKFYSAKKISNCAFILRGFDSSLSNLIFSKYNFMTKEYSEEKSISDLTNDGGYATQGNLLFDSATNQIVYVNYFSNRVCFLDTNLNLIQKTKTIDTFNTYQAMGVLKKADNNATFRTYAKPPISINYKSCIYKNYLLVNSGIRADNEINTNFKDSAVIDVYDITTKKYLLSFYIPKKENEKIKDLLMINNKIIISYSSSISIFKLNL